MQQDIDFMDLGARQENLQARGEPIMLQLCVVPAYSLTVRLAGASVKSRLGFLPESPSALSITAKAASRYTRRKP